MVVDSLYVRVLNFNATIYWKQSEFWSLRPTQFSVHYKSVMLSKNWSTSDCVVKNDPAHVFSCQFLTCELLEEGMYEVQVRINGSRGRSGNILSFHPSLESKRSFSRSFKDIVSPPERCDFTSSQQYNSNVL